MRPQDVLEQRYLLTELLGRGGFGEVWRAFDLRIRREVAVKVGRPQSAEEARRFALEAELVGNLNHPNIAALHDYGETWHEGERRIYLVMELVPGPHARTGHPRWHSTDRVVPCPGAGHLRSAGHRPRQGSGPPGRQTVQRDHHGLGYGIGQGSRLRNREKPGAHRHHGRGTHHRFLAVHGTGTLGERHGGRRTQRPVRPGLCADGVVHRTPPLRRAGVARTGRPARHQCPTASQFPATGPARGRRPADPGSARQGPRAATGERAAGRRPSGRHRRACREHHPDPYDTDPRRPGRRSGHTTTVLETSAGPASRPVDSARAVLERRLERVLSHHAAGDEPAFTRLLDTLIDDLTDESGADDPLTVEAVYQRAMYDWQTAHDQEGLERVLPRLIRVLGPDHRRTIDVQAVLTGNAAARGPIDGRGHIPELREIIARATRVLGASDPITLVARLDLAEALDRAYDAQGRPVPGNGPRDAVRAERRRALLAPLLPDLVRGLGDGDPRVTRTLVRLALDTYQVGDHPAALPLYERLLPTGPAALARTDTRLRVQHAHCVAETGDPERAVSLLDALLTTLRSRPGHDYEQQAAPALALRSTLKKRIRRDNRRTGHSWFRS